MTIIDEDIDLDIDMEVEIACDGVYRVCETPEEPVEWLYIKFCCGKRMLRCTKCKDKIVNLVCTPIVYCTFCHITFSMEDRHKHLWIKI